MKRAVFDTNLYIDWINHGSHEDLLVGPGLMRILSAVVVMELHAGARTRAAQKAVAKVERAYDTARRIAAPLPGAFRDAGVVLRTLRARGHEVRRSALVNDVLIALTARSHGATVFTRDADDFEAIQRVRDFALVVV